jgi:hypothetical protein
VNYPNIDRSTGSEETRRRPRRKIVEDILWSYATNPPMPQFRGTLLDINGLGLGILVDRPIRESSVLRVYTGRLWKGCRHVTVMHCIGIEQNVYRVGLMFNSHYKNEDPIGD